jgi:predicted DNA-binding transcriptional regulator YafY
VNRLERIHKIDQMITDRGTVGVHDFLSTLGISLATFKRDLDYLRSALHSPIQWDRDKGGYGYGKATRGRAAAMPAIWFNGAQTHALVASYGLLSSAPRGDGGACEIHGLAARALGLLSERGESPQQVLKRIVVEDLSAPSVDSQFFAPLASAVLNRRRVLLTLPTRGQRSATHQLSPMRLVYNRGQWLLEALRHDTADSLTVSVADVTALEVLNEKARERQKTVVLKSPRRRSVG